MGRVEEAMKLTKEQIEQIVVLLGGGDTDRKLLTRAFGERKNPYEKWRGFAGLGGRVPDLYDAAAKVADGVGDDGSLLYTRHDHEEAQAALKKIVEEIRGMA